VKIKVWHPEMSVEETKDLAYWERNMLALRYADGWYNDDVIDYQIPGDDWYVYKPRYEGWRRVLSLDMGKITFHVPDNFDVGNLPEIERNWDGHTTEQKWARIAERFGIEVAS
jgi:hypothetical protein